MALGRCLRIYAPASLINEHARDLQLQSNLSRWGRPRTPKRLTFIN
jgi:hypothetical protein